MSVIIDKKGIDEIMNDAQKAFSTENMAELANECVNFYNDSFINQGWEGVAWQKSKKDDKHATLISSGNLRRSIRLYHLQHSTFTIIADEPYAEIHNEGGLIPITLQMSKFFYAKYKESKKEKYLGLYIYAKNNIGQNFIMPKRQFMGESQTLTNHLIDYTNKFLT